MRKVLSVNETSSRLIGHNTTICSKKRKIKKKKKSKRGRPVGFKMSEASKAAISASKTGQKHSKVTKAKIAASVTAYYSCLSDRGFVVARVIVHKSDKHAMHVLKGK